MLRVCLLHVAAAVVLGVSVPVLGKIPDTLKKILFDIHTLVRGVQIHPDRYASFLTKMIAHPQVPTPT